MKGSIWIGFDPREAGAFAVARHSIERRMTTPFPVRGLVLGELRAAGLYSRPTEKREPYGQLWDVISDAPMSTEFAISRFLVPYLCNYEGWALFVDGDVMARENLARLFDQADPGKAVQVVKHEFHPADTVKMDGQIQTTYHRKNWSSVMLINCAHEANRFLGLEAINSMPGRDLHRFSWLKDNQIGALDERWNHLVGHSKGKDPALVHFTDGTPEMHGFEDQPYADEWREEQAAWAEGAQRRIMVRK